MWNEASSLLDLAPSRRAPGSHHAAAPIARVEAQEHRDDHAHAVAHVVHAPQDGSIDAQLNAYRLYAIYLLYDVSLLESRSIPWLYISPICSIIMI